MIFLGTVGLTGLGGLIGWLTRIWFEKRKRLLIAADRQHDFQREAVELALRWIDPLNLASIRVESLAGSFLFGRTDERHFMGRWPKGLSSELESLDLPAHLRPYLPDGTQASGLAILSKFHDLYYSIREVDRRNSDEVYLQLREVFELRAKINELRTNLEQTHRRTLG